MNNINAHIILEKALSSEFGIVVSTNDPEQLKALLNRVRTKQRKIGADYDQLQFKTSPGNPKSEVWIVKKG